MIKSIVVPIIFGTLVIGIAGHGDDLKRIGRLAVKSISYFWLMTTVALAIGLIAVNLTRPGVGVVLPPPDPNAPPPKAAPTTFGGFLEHVVPQSFFEAAARQRGAAGRLLGDALRHRAHPGDAAGPRRRCSASARGWRR